MAGDTGDDDGDDDCVWKIISEWVENRKMSKELVRKKVTVVRCSFLLSQAPNDVSTCNHNASNCRFRRRVKKRIGEKRETLHKQPVESRDADSVGPICLYLSQRSTRRCQGWGFKAKEGTFFPCMQRRTGTIQYRICTVDGTFRECLFFL